MARKSRKTIQAPSEAIITPPATPTFQTAVYARLSSEDREALSLENQILIVKNYVEEAPDMALYGVFSDNGLTGTNFNRPGFEALMDAVRYGKVNCIVVKDLSRFGRDYVEAGSFLEIIFPRLGVRFISIGDNYDSFDPRCQGEGMSVALKNMINAFYAKDISAKISSAYEVKRQKGEFTGKCPPFGYVKAPDNKNKLIVDEEAAEIVRQIFQLRLDGMGPFQIARKFSREGIPTPGHYRYIKGIQKEKRYSQWQYWDTTTVKDILESIVYLGHLAMGKTKIVNGKQRPVPKEEWVIAENTHQPIISQEDFDDVAELLRQSKEHHAGLNRHAREELPENLLAGLVYCADCGRAYRRIANTHRDRVTYRLTYVCLYCNQHSPKYQYQHYRQDDLYAKIYTIIKAAINSCLRDRDKFMKISASDVVRKRTDEMAAKIRTAQNRITHLSTLDMKTYDDYCSGILNEREHRLLVQKHADEKAALTVEIEKLTAQIKKLSPESIGSNGRVTAMQRFFENKELTREMLLALVERIEISGDRSINITFRYEDEYKRLMESTAEGEGLGHE